MALTVLMVLLSAVPLHVPGAGEVTPSLPLIGVFYWGMFCPGALPYTFLFLLGIVQDVLAGTPLGITSLINLTFVCLLGAERKLFGSAVFGAVWLGFALLSGVATIAQWGVMSLYSGTAFPFGVHVVRWGATCLAYPPMHLALTQVYKRLRPPS